MLPLKLTINSRTPTSTDFLWRSLLEAAGQNIRPESHMLVLLLNIPYFLISTQQLNAKVSKEFSLHSQARQRRLLQSIAVWYRSGGSSRASTLGRPWDHLPGWVSWVIGDACPILHSFLRNSSDKVFKHSTWNCPLSREHRGLLGLPGKRFARQEEIKSSSRVQRSQRPFFVSDVFPELPMFPPKMQLGR
jgi:hypothetical protein